MNTGIQPWVKTMKNSRILQEEAGKATFLSFLKPCGLTKHPLSDFSSLEREKINVYCFKPVHFMETSSRYFLSEISRKKNGSVKQILEVIVRAVQLHEEQLRKFLCVDRCSHEPTAKSSVVS